MELLQNQPKYYQIKQEILKDIKNGKYLPGTKMPPIRKLMTQYDIANATAFIIGKSVRKLN